MKRILVTGLLAVLTACSTTGRFVEADDKHQSHRQRLEKVGQVTNYTFGSGTHRSVYADDPDNPTVFQITSDTHYEPVYSYTAIDTKRVKVDPMCSQYSATGGDLQETGPECQYRDVVTGKHKVTKSNGKRAVQFAVHTYEDTDKDGKLDLACVEATLYDGLGNSYYTRKACNGEWIGHRDKPGEHDCNGTWVGHDMKALFEELTKDIK